MRGSGWSTARAMLARLAFTWPECAPNKRRAGRRSGRRARRRGARPPRMPKPVMSSSSVTSSRYCAVADPLSPSRSTSLLRTSQPTRPSIGPTSTARTDPNVLRLISNALRWLSKQTHEEQYAFDLFLAFSSTNREEARRLHDLGAGLGLRIFMAERNLQTGD